MTGFSYYAYDTETSRYAGQKCTEVWASTRCPIRTKTMQEHGKAKPGRDDVVIDGSIGDTIDWAEKQNKNLVFEVMNLKFDGKYITDWLYKNGWKYREKYKVITNGKSCYISDPHTFSVMVGDLGQWYTLTINLDNGHTLIMHDFAKLCPFSLEEAAEAFGTDHKKLEMNYIGERHEHCYISPEEKEYIQNDVLVLSELVEAFFSLDMMKSMTDAGCALKSYEETISGMYKKENFVNLAKCKLFNDDDPSSYYCGIEKDDYGSFWQNKVGKKVIVDNVDKYIRRAYHGGWCYVKKSIQGTVVKCNNVLNSVFDVNSLYPSQMHSSSGNAFPIGFPHMFHGKQFNKYEHSNDLYYFIRVRMAFKLKKDHLPCIQVKNSIYYKANEMLEDSRPTNSCGKKVKRIPQMDGTYVDDIVEMTISKTDWELIQEQYNITHMEVLDGVWFYTDSGMFDDYIDYWMHIKQTSTGPRRQIAKLMLNALYGRFAISPVANSKKPVYKDGHVVYQTVTGKERQPLSIAIGAAITSYARAFTVRAAQANYKDFCYADTDSIHVTCGPDTVKGITIDPVAMNCWKCETRWKVGKFVRTKTYIERVEQKDGKNVKPFWNVKCGGMPKECKELLVESMEESKSDSERHRQIYKIIMDGYANPSNEEYKATPEELSQDMIMQRHGFLSKKRTLNDFDVGLQIPGKLLPKTIPGGVILVNTTYTLNNVITLF